MVKYKLVKEYPGSLPLNSVVYQSEYKTFGKHTYKFILGNDHFHYQSDHIENYPELWKEYLFTTEDGVDIFKDDYYFPVEKGFYFLHEKQKNHHCTNEDKFCIFSTKEKAEEYIKSKLEPKYTIQDLIKAVNHYVFLFLLLGV
jgi:hypothetical protein